ncbi:MAG: hypothetical protein AAFZ65_03015 [Planctomycetota bacterium]
MERPLKLAAPLAAALLSACVAGEPAGPPLVVLSVSGAGSPAFSGAMEGARVAFLEADGERSTWEHLAALATGEEPPRVGAGERAYLPGSTSTLLETVTRAGFETAAFLDGPTLTEESGLLQGAFHLLDGPTLELSTDGPTDSFAADEALAFVGDKLPRPMEDAPAVWVHLNLSGAGPEEAERKLTGLWERFVALLDEHPEALLVGVALPTPSTPGAVLLRGAGSVPSRSDVPLALLDLPPTIAGLLGLPEPVGGGTDHSERLRR